MEVESSDAGATDSVSAPLIRRENTPPALAEPVAPARCSRIREDSDACPRGTEINVICESIRPQRNSYEVPRHEGHPDWNAGHSLLPQNKTDIDMARATALSAVGD